MGRVSTSRPVLSVLTKQPYVEITVADLATQAGLTLTQASNAVLHLRERGIHIEIPTRGVYRYVPGTAPKKEKEVKAEKPSKQLFEEFGRTKTGIIIVEGEDGSLYKLAEI